MSVPLDRDAFLWRPPCRRRPRLRPVARRLEQLAHRIYPEPTYTLQITTSQGTKTFVDCREVSGACGPCRAGPHL